MAHRFQIMLPEWQFHRLRLESERTGVPIAELVRRAVDAIYDPTPTEERIRLIRQAAGGWREEPGEDRAAYLRKLRGPGLGNRLGVPAR